MKKLTWIFGFVIIVIVAIVVVLSSMDTDNKESASSIPNTVQTEATAVNSNKYIAYSSDVIANTAGTKILFFHAPWCPQCRALEKSILEGDIPDGITFIKVDYDINQALRQKYGVTIQTTLVKIDDTGELVEKYVAYQEPNLQTVLDNLF